MEIVETIRQVYGNRMSLCSNSLTLQQKLVLASVLKFVASKSKSFTVDQVKSVFQKFLSANLSNLKNFILVIRNV